MSNSINPIEQHLCELCEKPMPEGEEMFRYHGFSGDCPKPPKIDIAKKEDEEIDHLVKQYKKNPRDLIPTIQGNSINPIGNKEIDEILVRYFELTGQPLKIVKQTKSYQYLFDKIQELLTNKTAEEWAICTDFLKNGGKIILRGFIDKDSALIARSLIESNDPKHRTFAVDEINRNRIKALHKVKKENE